MDAATSKLENNPALEIAALTDSLFNSKGAKNMIILGYSDALK